MSRSTSLITFMVAGLLALGATARPGAQALTADGIVAHYLQAIGGTDALGKLTSRRATGTVTISTPNGEASGPIEILAKAPNKSRASMTLDVPGAGQLEVSQRFDGTAAWLSDPVQGDIQVGGTQLENMRNGRFPTALLRYQEYGTTLELLPKAQFDGHAVLVVRGTPKVGPAVTMFFDPDSYLLLRTSVVVTSPQLGGDVELISDSSDYRDVSGIKVPFHIVNASGGQTVTIVLTKVEHNVAIDDSAFTK